MTDKPKVIEFRSDDSPSIVYACGRCGYTKPNQELAERCCICEVCGAPVVGSWLKCDDCRRAGREKDDAERLAREWALPVVEDKGEPVLAGDKFYETVDEAAEAIWDDSGDPTTVIAHPCTVSRVDTPQIQELVEEHWYTQFEDADESTIAMSKGLAEACTELQKRLEAEAPISWIPRTKERVALPAIDETKVVHLRG